MCASPAIGRRHIEDHKRWLAARPGKKAPKLSTTTIRHRLGLLRTFFERIIDWDYDDAPARSPIFPGDFPERDEPLPKFLDDPTAAKFMAALAADPNQRRRLMVELLARTGHARRRARRARRTTPWSASATPTGCASRSASSTTTATCPLHPILVELITDWLATRPTVTVGLLVERDDGQPFDRRTIHRYVAAVAKRAGVGHVHPHQLRHTLATQAINRGMSLEAIAALLGHRSMRMTLTYARISDRTVADEYFRVTEAVEASYRTSEPLPADGRPGRTCDASPPTTADCSATATAPDPPRSTASFETICERCGFFDTGPQFVPILRRQRDHAVEHDQPRPRPALHAASSTASTTTDDVLQ